MKKAICFLFLIPSILFVSGCKVKFQKNGESKTKEEFNKILDSAYKSWKFKEDNELESLRFSSKSKNESYRTYFRNDKVIKKQSVIEKQTQNYKFDKKNSLFNVKSKTSRQEKASSVNGSSKSQSNKQTDKMIQKSQYQGTNFVVEVDNKSKMFCPCEVISGKTTIKSFLNTLVNRYVRNDFSINGKYSSNPKSECKYFIKGNVFTIETTLDKTEEEKEENVVLYKIQTKEKSKLQLDFTENNMSLKYYYEYDEETYYCRNYDSFVFGDVATYSKNESIEKKLTSSKVKLKSKDISKYKGYDFERYFNYVLS